MLANVSSSQVLSMPQLPPAETCQRIKIATQILKILGVILMSAGIGAFTAGLQVPAIALAVAGAVSLLLGFELGKKGASSHVSPAPVPNNNVGIPPIQVPTPSIPPTSAGLSAELSTAIGRISAVEPLGSEKLEEHLCGAMVGQAVGDALGLATEFLTKAEAQALFHGKVLELSNPAFAIGRPAIFAQGGFTDDTEQACAIVRAIDQNQKHPEKPLAICFAEQLHHWLHHGLDSFHGQYNTAEVAPLNGARDVGILTRQVLTQKSFLEEPQRTALEVWVARGKNSATNGAVMRTSVVGAIYFRDLATVVEKSILFASVTHADPRSIASAVALSVAIALFLQGHKSPSAVMQHAQEIALVVLCEEMQKKAPYYSKEDLARLTLEYSQGLKDHLAGTWDSLQLAGRGIGYTYKCIGAAFCALRRAVELKEQNDPEPFRTVIQEVVEEGGDADTNAAAAGALLGAYLNLENIPDSWCELNDNCWDVLEQNVVLTLNLYQMEQAL